MREGDQMTDEKTPDGAPSSDTDATAPQSAGGWDAPPLDPAAAPAPDAAAAPPPAWSPPPSDAAAAPPPAASPAPLAPLVSSTPPPAIPPPAYTPQPAVAWQAAPPVAVASGRSALAAGAGISLL